MTSQLETRKPNTDTLALCMVPILWKSVGDHLIEFSLGILHCEAAILQTLLQAIWKARKERDPELRGPEVTINGEVWERVDVRDAAPERIVEQATRKEDAGKDDKPLKKAQKEAKKRHRRESKRLSEADKQREQEWEELWERKIKLQEELDDTRCCLGEGLCMKPRTQSSIWINVTEDRNCQDILMTFKHTPVPRPKPPPLPLLRAKSSFELRSQPSTTEVDEEVEEKGAEGKHERKGMRESKSGKKRSK